MTTSASPDLRDALDGLPEVRGALQDERIDHLKISPDGRLSVHRDQRWQISRDALDIERLVDLLAVLSDALEPPSLDDWHFRVFQGGLGPCVFAERRQMLPTYLIPDAVCEGLLEQARRGGTGMIVGPAGSGKAGLLNWLVKQLGRRALVTVSEMAPSELLESTATHVFPPNDRGERRSLERLLHAHDSIFWERVSDAEDLRCLMSAPTVHNRWFTLDAADLADGLRRVEFLADTVPSFDLDALAVADLGQDGPEVVYLASRIEGSWREIYTAHGVSLSAALESFEGVGVDDRHFRVTTEMAPQPIPEGGFAEPRMFSEVSEVDSFGAEPADPPADEPPGLSAEASDFGVEPAGLSQNSEGMSVAELLADDDVEDEAMLRSSGEIDLQSMLARRERSGLHSAPDQENPPPQALDQDRDHSDAHEAITNVVPGEDVDGIIAEMEGDIDPEIARELAEFDRSQLSPPVIDEVTALTPVDLDRIREIADDDVSKLIEVDEPTSDVSQDFVRQMRKEEISEAIFDEFADGDDDAETAERDSPTARTKSEASSFDRRPSRHDIRRSNQYDAANASSDSRSAQRVIPAPHDDDDVGGNDPTRERPAGKFRDGDSGS